MRRISILGSTGSIGTQSLQIAALHPDRFEVAALTAHTQAEKLFEQVRLFRPQMAGLSGLKENEVQIPSDLLFCTWRFGDEALLCAAGEVECDDVLVAVVGMRGLPAVMAARKAGRRVLLANKEALIAGGELVMAACPDKKDGPTLIPVDSEHSAIYQSLKAAQGNPYEKILLTASGGAFRDFTLEQLKSAALSQALTHPNWSMGAKITVDSATMFNKALEVIEAKWLFNAAPEQIEVVIHPESVIHSMVQFKDGAVLAELGMPDMRVPIAYAMSYPERIETASPKVDFAKLGKCTFSSVDNARFPAVQMAYDALRAGGAAACMLNAANEEANARFRKGGIGFMQIADVVRETLSRIGTMPAHSMEAVYAADALARRTAIEIMEKM